MKKISEEAKKILKPEWDKMQDFLKDGKDRVIEDLKKANQQIVKRHRYSCGLASEEVRASIGCGDLFFESPDGQNGELYYELKKLGWRNAGYSAEYYWKVRKGNWLISFTEGDIYIKNVSGLQPTA